MKTNCKNRFLLPAIMIVLGLMPAGRAPAQDLTTLYNFSQVSSGPVYINSDGSWPWAGLLLSGNTLYGTTVMGGRGYGTLFEVNTDGTCFTNLHTFADQTNESSIYPKTGLIQINNALYGADYTGGLGYGSVYCFNTNGPVYTTLHEFPYFLYGATSVYNTNGPNSDGGFPSGELLYCGNMLYGLCSYGGGGGSGTVYTISTNGGGFRVLHAFTAQFVAPNWTLNNPDGAHPIGNLAISPTGNTLYGTTQNGGSFDAGVVFSMATDGSAFTTLYAFNPVPPNNTSDGYGPTCGVVVSPSGDTLYGTTKKGGGYGSGRVFSMNEDGSGYTILHDFTGTTPTISYNATNSGGEMPCFNNDGATPTSPLILSPSGKILYGTTSQGGSGGFGTVFAMKTNGTDFTVVYNCATAANEEAPNVGGDQPNKLLLVGSTLYGTGGEGGTYGQGTVFSIALGLSASISATPSVCHIGDTITAVVNVANTDPENNLNNVQLAFPMTNSGAGGISFSGTSGPTNIPVLAPLARASFTNLYTATNHGTVTFSATVSAVNANGGTTTNQATSPILNIVPKGDLLIKRGSDPASCYAGAGVYQTAPIPPQIVTNVVQTNQTSTIGVIVTNNDSQALYYTLVARQDNPDWTTHYIMGSQDITSQITSGMSLPKMNPGDSLTLTINSISPNVSSNGIVVSLGLASDETVTLDAVQAENVASPIPVTMILHRIQYDGFTADSIAAGIGTPLQPVSDPNILASQPVITQGLVADEVTPLLIEVQADSGKLALFPNGRTFDAAATINANGTVPGPILTQILDPSVGAWGTGTNFVLSPTHTNAFLLIGPFASDDVELDGGNELLASVQIMDQAAGTQSGWQAFAIRKPPIYLVHGYASPGNWDPAFMNILSRTRPMTAEQDPNNFVVTIHYGAGVVPGYWVNAALPVYENTIDKLSDCAVLLSNELYWARSTNLQNWAMTRFDVVAHSQGGVLSRMLSSQTVNTKIGAPYRNADNFMRGRFHRVVTIGSPHNGSRLLHYLLALTTANCGGPFSTNLYGSSTPIGAITAMATVWSQIAQPKFDPFGEQIQDLNNPSPAGNWYPDPAAQFHLIRAVTDGGESPRTGDTTLAYQLLDLVFTNGGQTVIPQGSDGVVDYDSMAANVPPAAVAANVYDMPSAIAICHAGPCSFFGGTVNETASTDIARHVIDALDQSGPEDAASLQFGSFPLPALLTNGIKQAIDNFACSVFQVSPIQAISQHIGGFSARPRPMIDSPNNYYFQINFPYNEPPAGNVTWFALNYGTNGVTDNGITCTPSGTNNSQVTVSVDSGLIGDVVLFAFYQDTGNQLVQVTGQLVVSQAPPAATLTGIGLLPWNPTVPAGAVLPVQVVALYSDGSSCVRYLTNGELAATSSNPSVVSVSDPMNWQLLSGGNAQVVGACFGFSATNQVSVFVSASDTITNLAVSLGGNLACGVVPIGSSSSNTLTISNAGNVTLTVNSISYPNEVFGGSWTGGQIGAGESQAVTVTFSPASATNYAGAVTVNSDATSGTNTIRVSGFWANTNCLLTILTNGDGTVTPNDARVIKQGTKVCLKAVAGKTNVFSCWTGSTNCTNNPLTFVMKKSTILQANFIPNPFLPFVGTYNGLFWAGNGVVAETNAGMLKGLTLTSKGTYSGCLLINGASKSFSGCFNVACQAAKPISLGGKEGTLELVMTLTSNSPAPQVTGTVSGNGWEATNLIANLSANTPLAADYTVLISPDTNNSSSPIGYGYALICTSGTTRTPATARITGALADGTAFSQSAPVSEDGSVPIYANLYSGKGLLLGWVNLDPTNASGSALYCVHPVRTGLFSGAFATANTIALSPWTNFPAASVLPTNLVVVVTVNKPPFETNDFALTITNETLKFGKSSGPSIPLEGCIAPKTGLMKVTFGSGASKTTGYGVVLLNGTNGGGYFLTKTNSGAIILSP